MAKPTRPWLRMSGVQPVTNIWNGTPHAMTLVYATACSLSLIHI